MKDRSRLFSTVQLYHDGAIVAQLNIWKIELEYLLQRNCTTMALSCRSQRIAGESRGISTKVGYSVLHICTTMAIVAQCQYIGGRSRQFSIVQLYHASAAVQQRRLPRQHNCSTQWRLLVVFGW